VGIRRGAVNTDLTDVLRNVPILRTDTTLAAIA
jgi:hypothetical protein